ncbi:conserved hypothetical protein [Vibrio crassostreae]|nr:conserved hypothetical protein [Vibrio crassostreae]CAK3485429.1 conserved hypothetical protein [Vibrio crassostreae]CAK3505659.1 conserved hypothetical protein [Vibrio crassostreae]CAK3542025.1 conserved hypothetical protein [Vibrio crassostreae]CAK3550948.1 conserved hypothetical protein [Vibrio crassostreae]
MFAKVSTAIQLVLAVAVFYLGYTIYSFTNKVCEIVDTYPQIIEDLSVLTKGLKVEEWLEFASHVDELAPRVLDTVEDVRKTIDDVNQTVASVDNKIPAILDEVKNVRTEVEQVRTDVIPPTLIELKRYRVDVMPPMLAESKSYREQTIPVIVTESEMLRAEVPGILAQANLLVDKSKELAQGAAEGAVKGVVLSPFNLLRDAGDGIKTRVQGEFEPTPEAE